MKILSTHKIQKPSGASLAPMFLVFKPCRMTVLSMEVLNEPINNHKVLSNEISSLF